MNILITNAVPLNGGDEALLRATVESVKARWPQTGIITLCKNVKLARRHMPDLSFAPDLEFATEIAELQEVSELYRKADLVLSAAGGFFHDHYPIEDRLRGFEFALDLGKPVIVFAQSVGPFWKPDSFKRVREVFNRLSAICVRDAQSRAHLLACGVEAGKIHDAADAAFLWHRLAPELFRPKSAPLRTIGLCFRVWPPGDTLRVQETIVKAQELCRYLLAGPERKLVFISTCQGITGYMDDSELALKIVGGLPMELKARCEIDRVRHAPREFMKRLSGCDAFIGMRLHGCIQAMLAGTPAMGLGYEHKTEEIFGQLGLGEFQTPFDGTIETWLDCAKMFLAHLPEIRSGLSAALDRVCRQAKLNLEVLGRVLHLNPSAAISFEQRSARHGRAYHFLDKLYERIQWNQKIPPAVEDIAAIIPPGENFVLVDEDVLDRSLLNRWRPISFVEKDGAYFGPPADSATAIIEFERLREGGANFAVIAWPAFWWLEHYGEFTKYLESRFACVRQTGHVVLFDLRQPAKNSAATVREDLAPSRPDGLKIIERVLDEKLTYLTLSALVDLQSVVKHVEKINVPGIFIEAGCALGGSALAIAASKSAARRLALYDVFGMIPPPSANEPPEVHERYRLIKSGQATGIGHERYYGYEKNVEEGVAASFVRFGLEPVSSAVSFVKGLYEETLRVNEPVALAHIDCDWYESVLTCLQRIEPHLSPGGVLVIDDYFRWPGCRRAVDEYFAGKMREYEFQTKSRLHIVRAGKEIEA